MMDETAEVLERLAVVALIIAIGFIFGAAYDLPLGETVSFFFLGVFAHQAVKRWRRR